MQDDKDWLNTQIEPSTAQMEAFLERVAILIDDNYNEATARKFALERLNNE